MASGLLFTLILCTLWTGGTTKCAPRPAAFCETCPPGWTWYGGHCYLFVKSEKDWADAESHCNSLDGNLASIQSSDEYTFIRDLVFREAGSHPRTWVGGHDAVKDGVWMWSDGSKFVFSSWGKGEPNNNAGGESCMEINLRGNDYVNDEKCNGRKPFLCVRDP
ncbi:galactose-specific lectin nattectin-like [Kryptolebias marmoratus]|uniref:Galactose-specific lectin nattectin-like n=1 Tax=Kryptolebias marmoratus TaxID=37003 RepID=A0A3Q3B111_KRYMA|nr:galactose-specific lectin nattectin-like [Kryptolebias marmoratus]